MTLLRLKDVGMKFSIPGRKDKKIEIIKNVSLEVHEKELITIHGPSGSGKTTLLSLILRLYDVQAGTVLVDGLDLNWFFSF